MSIFLSFTSSRSGLYETHEQFIKFKENYSYFFNKPDLEYVHLKQWMECQKFWWSHKYAKKGKRSLQLRGFLLLYVRQKQYGTVIQTVETIHPPSLCSELSSPHIAPSRLVATEQKITKSIVSLVMVDLTRVVSTYWYWYRYRY